MHAARRKYPKLRVLVCRVTANEESKPIPQKPVVEFLSADEKGRYLSDIKRIIGNDVECITLDKGVELCGTRGQAAWQLPLNRVLSGVPRSGLPDFISFEIDPTQSWKRQPQVWRIHGDFLLTRHDEKRNLVSLTDDDIAHFEQLWGATPSVATPSSNGLGRAVAQLELSLKAALRDLLAARQEMCSPECPGWCIDELGPAVCDECANLNGYGDYVTDYLVTLLPEAQREAERVYRDLDNINSDSQERAT